MPGAALAATWLSLSGCAVGETDGHNPYVTPSVATSGAQDSGSGGDEGSGTFIPNDGDGGGSSSGGPTPPPGDCCEASHARGCVDPGIEACVCQLDPDCCDDMWSTGCVALVDAGACGTCEDEPNGGETTGAPPPMQPTNACCATSGAPGCVDAGVQSCVCASDVECCNVAWDAGCVAAVEELGCGSCGGGTTGGGNADPCCSPQPGPGCPDLLTEACVCLFDAYCCEVEWDDICVATAGDLGCADC